MPTLKEKNTNGAPLIESIGNIESKEELVTTLWLTFSVSDDLFHWGDNLLQSN